MDAPILRGEYNEFKESVKGRFKRNDKRIEILESSLSELNRLTTAVEKLALNVEQIVSTQNKQDEEIEDLKGKDGDMWRTCIKYVATMIVGGALGLSIKAIMSGLM